MGLGGPVPSHALLHSWCPRWGPVAGGARGCQSGGSLTPKCRRLQSVCANMCRGHIHTAASLWVHVHMYVSHVHTHVFTQQHMHTCACVRV